MVSLRHIFLIAHELLHLVAVELGRGLNHDVLETPLCFSDRSTNSRRKNTSCFGAFGCSGFSGLTPYEIFSIQSAANCLRTAFCREGALVV